jgi:hypothetical protein
MCSMVSTCPTSSLSPNFDTPFQFNAPSKGIRVLRVPLGISSFTSSFIKNVMLEDVWHVDLLPIMGDAQITFRLVTHNFVQWPSYLLQWTPSSSTFIKFLFSFDISVLQMFKRLLGQGSFDSLKGPLYHQQTFFLITFNGIGFIRTTTITLITYLGKWALVVSIIAIKFMIDQHPFLFGALTWVNNYSFLS